MKNLVIIQGNLTRDPEMRYSPKGDAVANLGVAINETWEGKDGQRREVTNFVDVVFFGEMAEKCQRQFRKGNAVFIQGRLKTDQWEDKQSGAKRSKLVVSGQIITSPFAGQGKLPESRPVAKPKAPAPPTSAAEADFRSFDPEVPF